MPLMQADRRFDLEPLAIRGVMAVRRRSFGDARGSLTRIFCTEELAAAGWRWPVAQVNHSVTAMAGTVRGMHYQAPPWTEAKLVTCLRGRAWDVALDLRAGSPTFLRYCAQELSCENGIALLIPPGCAHGFQALTDEVELLYLHSVAYAASHDRGINPQDPRCAIAWPMPVAMLSPKDRSRPMLGPDFGGITP